jgi:aryl-alcohol dehydrogenase-like predicted oxidoreductase
MKYRRLGNSTAQISAIGLGGMAMTDIYGKADEGEAIATIHAALDSGLNFIDTSDAYASGRNEEMIGLALKGRRDKAVIATKFGNLGNAVNGKPAYVAEACDKSLRRLGIDEIDIYFQHRVDPEVPIEDTVGAMERLVEQGKVRWLGLSEAGPETIRRAHKVHPIAALQTEYSLWSRFVEDDILPTCRTLGIGFVAYSPLGRGMLTGAIAGAESLAENDRRKDHPRFQQGNLEKNVQIMQPLAQLAGAKGCTPAQLALAWLLHQGDEIVPIPGSKRRSHMAENAKAADISLTPDELAKIGEAIDPAVVAGTRYPAGQLKRLGI